MRASRYLWRQLGPNHQHRTSLKHLREEAMKKEAKLIVLAIDNHHDVGGPISTSPHTLDVSVGAVFRSNHGDVSTRTLDKFANDRCGCGSLQIDSVIKEENIAPRRHIFTC